MKILMFRKKTLAEMKKIQENKLFFSDTFYFFIPENTLEMQAGNEENRPKLYPNRKETKYFPFQIFLTLSFLRNTLECRKKTSVS